MSAHYILTNSIAYPVYEAIYNNVVRTSKKTGIDVARLKHYGAGDPLRHNIMPPLLKAALRSSVLATVHLELGYT